MSTTARTLSLIGISAVTTALVAIPTQADDFSDGQTAHAVVTVETLTAQPGDTVDVSIALNADDLVGAFSINAFAQGIAIEDVLYDGPLFSNGWEGWDTSPGEIINVSGACIFTEDQVTGAQQLVSLRLTIPEDAEDGSFIPVDLSNVQISNYQFTPYEVTLVAGGINIEGETLCGADIALGDGVVDINDLLMMLAAWGPCSDDCSADLDGNNAVDIDDVLELLSAWGSCE